MTRLRGEFFFLDLTFFLLHRTSAVDNDGDKLTINVAAVSCGPRRHEFLVMAKSAVMFSMNAFLHFIVFSDKSSILDLAQDVRTDCKQKGVFGFRYNINVVMT